MEDNKFQAPDGDPLFTEALKSHQAYHGLTNAEAAKCLKLKPEVYERWLNGNDLPPYNLRMAIIQENDKHKVLPNHCGGDCPMSK